MYNIIFIPCNVWWKCALSALKIVCFLKCSHLFICVHEGWFSSSFHLCCCADMKTYIAYLSISPDRNNKMLLTKLLSLFLFASNCNNLMIETHLMFWYSYPQRLYCMQILLKNLMVTMESWNVTKLLSWYFLVHNLPQLIRNKSLPVF